MVCCDGGFGVVVLLLVVVLFEMEAVTKISDR